MTRIGCTGHQNLSLVTRRLVAAAIAAVLATERDADLVGFTSLAEGADQLFAFTLLAAGGQLHAIIPSEHYAEGFQSIEARKTYISLLDFATNSTTLHFRTPSEDAYLAAGHHVADNCDILLAVWDGKSAAGKGGTADIVGYALDSGRDTRVIWPAGANRS